MVNIPLVHILRGFVVANLPLSLLSFLYCDKHSDQKKLGEERVDSSNTSLKEYRARIQANSKAKAIKENHLQSCSL